MAPLNDVHADLQTLRIRAALKSAAFGQATAPEPEFSGGMTLAAQAGLPRLKGTPDIRVEIVASAADPGGLSGLPTLVLAPALANAVAAGTGLRMRAIPFAPGTA